MTFSLPSPLSLLKLPNDVMVTSKRRRFLLKNFGFLDLRMFFKSGLSRFVIVKHNY